MAITTLGLCKQKCLKHIYTDYNHYSFLVYIILTNTETYLNYVLNLSTKFKFVVTIYFYMKNISHKS